MAINTNYYNYLNSSLFNGYGLNYGQNTGRVTSSGVFGQLYSSANSSQSSNLSQYGFSSNSVDYNMQQYVVSMKNGANELRNSLRDLSTKSPVSSAFNKQTVSSSDEDVLSVQSVSKYGTANFSEAKVSVQQLAAGQQNAGESFAATDTVESGGYRQIQIDIGGKSHQVSFTVSEGETMKSMQQKLADAINKKDIGIKANIETKNGESTLNLKATATGAENEKAAFAVMDMYGDAAAATGINNVVQEAVDAMYTVDGVSKTSGTNTVEIGGNVSANLYKTSDEEITVSAKIDNSSAIDAVKDMVNSFNSLMELADSESVSGTAGGNRLLRELTGVSNTYAATLGQVGINVDSYGYMSVDEDKLGRAAEQGYLQRLFESGGANYGVASKLNQVADNIRLSPTRYVAGVYPNMVEYANTNSSSEDESDFVTNLRNIMNNTMYNNMGMMFNFLI